MNATVLLSLGRHPVSLRPRLADLDARAIGLARGLGARVSALHAGAAEAATALRGCLGMGVRQLLLLDTPQGDPLPALAAQLRATGVEVILAGAQAETGEGSGMVPFLLAEQLGCALLPRAVALEVADGAARITQALPGGRRRVLRAALPVIVTVERSAPPPPLSALGPAMRGRVRHLPGAAPVDLLHGCATRPSRRSSRRLAAPGSLGGGGARQELIDPDPITAADAILDFLRREALFADVSPQMTETS